MANPHRGETSVEIGGKTYVLCYGMNACAELENHLGRSFPEIVAELQSWKENPERIRVTTVRALLWAGLRRRHSSVTLEQAGDLIDEIGFSNVWQPVNEAFERAWPDPDEAETKGQRPTNGTGTGKVSSETSSVSGSPARSSGASPPDS